MEYCGQKSAWMSSEIFHAWFHNSFIPTVRKELSSLGLEPKAVLVLDNCPAHPNEEDLSSDDGNNHRPLLATKCHFLDPTTMDQGVLVALKRRYKKKLLQRLLIEDENGVSLIDFLKSVNMKIVTELIAESWGEIKESTLRKSWRKIMPIQEPAKSEDQTEGQEDGDEDEQEFMHEFQELGYSMDANEISTWLNSDSNDPGFQLMTDDEICDHVLSEQVPDQEDEPEPEEGVSNVCPVSNSMAAHMFEKCLTWLEYQLEVNQYNTCTLRELHALAVRKRGESLKQRTLLELLQK